MCPLLCPAKLNANDPINTNKAKEILKDLADFGVPVVLFSGGEPIMREDLVELAKYSVELGMRLLYPQMVH